MKLAEQILFNFLPLYTILFIDFLLRRSLLILSTNLASFGSVKINCVDIVHVLVNLLI